MIFLLEITKYCLMPRVNNCLLFDTFKSLQDSSQYIWARSGCWVEIMRHEKLDPSDPTLVFRTPPI